jgi:mRNA-degrading endonuclease toxin of MazEF toxin-antitoxin module
MNVGEVYWVEFPAGAGRAQARRRPAIVVQSARASACLPTVLLVPLTTQQEALRFPGTVLVEPDSGNRLPRISVALVFQIIAVDRRFGKAGGHTGPAPGNDVQRDAGNRSPFGAGGAAE